MPPLPSVAVGSGSSLRQQGSKARRQTPSRWAGLARGARQLVRILLVKSSDFIQETQPSSVAPALVGAMEDN